MEERAGGREGGTILRKLYVTSNDTKGTDGCILREYSV